MTTTKRELTGIAKLAKKLRNDYKAKGWTSKDISVKSENYSMGRSLHVSIKNARVDYKTAKEMAEDCQSIRYDQYTQEILSGGNTYVHFGIEERALTASFPDLYSKLEEMAETFPDNFSHEFRDNPQYSFDEFPGLVGLYGTPSGLRFCPEDPWKGILTHNTGEGSSICDTIARSVSAEKEYFPRSIIRCLYTAGLIKVSPAEGKGTSPTPLVDVPEGRYNAPEMYHNERRGFDYYLVTVNERLGKDLFKEELARAKAGRGWYSKQWGDVPGGFAFKEESAAQTFAGGGCPSPTPDPNPRTNPKAPKGPNPEKFRTNAEKLRAKVNQMREPMTQNATPKRVAQRQHRLIDADRKERLACILEGVANATEAGTLPDILRPLTTFKDYEPFCSQRTDATNHGYHYGAYENGEWYNNSPEAEAARAYLVPESPEEREARELQDEIDQLKLDGQGIPDFFPTPDDLIDKMITHLNIEEINTCTHCGDLESHEFDSAGKCSACYRDVHTVDSLGYCLEPSAGIGSIIDRVRERYPSTCFDAVESNHRLAGILRRKYGINEGVDILQMDLLDTYGNESYDSIIMNPPFSKRQDAAHICHAYKMLKPGGRLVSVASAGTVRSERGEDCRALQALIKSHGYTVELDPGQFSEAFRRTKVNVVLVVLDK